MYNILSQSRDFTVHGGKKIHNDTMLKKYNYQNVSSTKLTNIFTHSATADWIFGIIVEKFFTFINLKVVFMSI